MSTNLTVPASLPKLNEIGRYIFPTIKPDKRDRPIVDGTGILLAVDRYKFVVTAAHVLDQDDDGTIYLPDGVILGPASTSVVKTSIPAGGHREDDRVDVAVFRITDEQFAGLVAKGRAAIQVSMIGFGDGIEPGKKYVFTGFPSSKTGLNPPERKLAPRGVSANCLTEGTTLITGLGLNPATHIVVRFDPKQMMDDEGRRITAPSPVGMSGGAIWTLDPSGLYKWVGVGIEYRKKECVLVGTRVGAVIALLRSAYPEVVPFLTKSDCGAFTVKTP